MTKADSVEWKVFDEPVNAMGLTAQETELQQTRLMMEEAVRRMSLSGMALGLEAAKTEKDTAYNERNRLVALLARIFPSGVLPEVTSPDYQIVYIDLPTGQASWHIPTAEMPLFSSVPPYQKSWDQHTTTEKWQRVEKLVDVLKNFDVTITPRTAEPPVFKSEYPADTKLVFEDVDDTRPEKIVATGGKRFGKQQQAAASFIGPNQSFTFDHPVLLKSIQIRMDACVGGGAVANVWFEKVT